jgi:hypothetical protein
MACGRRRRVSEKRTMNARLLRGHIIALTAILLLAAIVGGFL